MFAVQTSGLGRRYGTCWALRDLSLDLPAGHVVGLVGPNGAGKSTFLQLAVGLQRPTHGTISVLDLAPRRQAARLLPRIGYVGQETNLFRRFKVEDLLTLGAKLNERWDGGEVRHRLRQLGVGVELAVNALSGGMRAQVALALALAKQPELLLLDEPVAALDPLARHEFMQQLMEASAEKELSVVFSSHLVGELHASCDYLVVLANGSVQLEGDVDEIVGGHQRLVGPIEAVDNARAIQPVVAETISARQATLLVRSAEAQFDARWTREPVDLEEIVLAYLRNAASVRLDERAAA